MYGGDPIPVFQAFPPWGIVGNNPLAAYSAGKNLGPRAATPTLGAGWTSVANSEWSHGFILGWGYGVFTHGAGRGPLGAVLGGGAPLSESVLCVWRWARCSGGTWWSPPKMGHRWGRGCRTLALLVQGLRVSGVVGVTQKPKN